MDIATDNSIEPETKPEAPKFEWVRKINIKYLLIAIVIVGIAALAYYYKAVFIAATVDGQVITRFSVVKKLEKQDGKTILDSLINSKLIDNATKEKNITISDGEVEDQIKTITAQITAQGGTLDAALTQANLTMADLKLQITNELKIEKLLGDKAAVSDAEVDKYITDNKITLQPGQEASTKDQIRNQLKQGKVSSNADAYLADLRTKAKIKNYVNY